MGHLDIIWIFRDKINNIISVQLYNDIYKVRSYLYALITKMFCMCHFIQESQKLCALDIIIIFSHFMEDKHHASNGGTTSMMSSSIIS